MKNNIKKISAVILTKNEENNIVNAIKSLNFCDEVIVVDDNSKDKTTQLAKKLGAKVFKRSLNQNFAGQRNFGLSKCRYDWVFFLDADEVVTNDLAQEILKSLKRSNFNGFYVKRDLSFLGYKISHGEVGSTKLLRMGRKSKGKWTRGVHEEWRLEGEFEYLKNPVLHNQNKNLYEFIGNINKYSEIHSIENKNENKDFNFLFVMFHPVGKFFVNYILKLGFLDGTPGFILAILMSFHSFLSWSRLWLKKN